MTPVQIRIETEIRHLMQIDQRLEDELRIVAELSVARSELAEIYYPLEHMQISTWWMDQKLYHMFMMLLYFEWEGTESGFWDRIKKKGREILDKKVKNPAEKEKK